MTYTAVLIPATATGPVLALLSSILLRTHGTCKAKARNRGLEPLPLWLSTSFGMCVSLVQSFDDCGVVQRDWRCASGEILIGCCQDSHYLAVSVLSMARPAGRIRSNRWILQHQ